MRGLRLEGKKEATLLVWTLRRPALPKKVRIPLRHDLKNFSKPCVAAGDKVKIGETLATPATQAAVSIHSSVSGTVTAIESFPHPLWGKCQAVEIESDKTDSKAPDFGKERKGWENLSRQDLLKIFQDSGLVDLEPGMAPLHCEAASEISTLVLDACEAEPYLTCDHALMMSHPVEILKGAEILRKACAAEQVVILMQDNQLEAAETLKSKIYFLKWPHFEVQILPSIYPVPVNVIARRPQADEATAFPFNKTAIASLPPRSSPLGSEARNDRQIFNIATSFAVYEAVALQKPLIERAVTLGGECLIEPKNIWARIGTDFDTLVKVARGFLRPPGKVLMNGPMAGIAQDGLDVPVIAGTQAVLALPTELTTFEEPQPCIRCGRCVEVCPEEISPVMITLAAEQELFEVARAYGADACTECGNCTYVCPSKRPMLELIRDARSSRLPRPASLASQ